MGRFGAVLGATSVILAAAVGCDSGPRAAPVPPAPLDLAAVMDRVHGSFSADLVGGDARYEVRVRADGSFSVAPGDRAEVAPVVLETALGPGRPRLDDDGSIAIVRDTNVTERLRVVRDGLEQSWEVAEKPRGDGPLAIRVRLRGQAWSSETAGGHHFVDARTGLGVRYGRATWIDASGRSVPVAVRRDGDALAMEVPRATLEASAFPAVLDPVIGPEMGVDAPIASGLAGPSAAPIVRPGPAGTFLVAWFDTRSGTSETLVTARVDATGKVLGRELAPVQIPFPYPTYLDAAYDPGTARWLVVAGGAYATLAVRVDATTGAMLDPAPLRFVEDTTAQQRYAVNGLKAAFDGTSFVVFTSTGATKTAGIHATRVSTAGTIGTDVMIAGAVAPLRGAACDGAACAVLWGSGSSTVLSRVSNAGALLDATPITVDTGDPQALAYDGAEYLALYGSGSSLLGRRISAAGAVLDASPITVATSAQAWNARGANLIWNGTRFVAMWADAADVYARRLTSAGALDDASPVLVSGNASSQIGPDLAWSGTQYLVAWLDARDVTHSGIYATRASTTLAATDGAAGFLLSDGANMENTPAVASNGSGYLVTWIDSRAGGTDLWGARLSASGAVVGGAFAIASGASATRVASNGTDYLVTWLTGASPAIRAARVSGTTGAVLDATPLTLTTFAGSSWPAVVFDGTNYVVAWSDLRYSAFSFLDLYAARVSPAGALLDPDGIVVSSAVAAQRDPALASDGTNVLVTWADYRFDYNSGDVYGARLDKTGKILDPGGFPVAVAGYDQATPAVAWDGTSFVVAWADSRRLGSWTGEHDVYVTRVTSAGKSLSTTGALVAQTGTPSPRPVILSMGDGVSDLVAWSGVDDSGVSRVRGSWIRGATGEVLDPGGVPLVPEPGAATWPALAPNAPGKVALLYSRYTADLAARVQGRFVESGIATSQACTAATDCRSRFCIDGVCCEEACDAPCMRCGTDGKCAAVHGADDAQCTGSRTCDAAGACKKKNGESCEVAGDCATGFCADGFCCNTACDGACDSCSATPGTCTVSPLGAAGTPSCSPRLCNGVDATCPATCTNDDQCAEGFGCDRPTGTCVAGAVCSDDHTLRAPGGAKTDCRPYACRLGACATSCKAVTDCAYPAACDELGRCVTPASTSAGGGCSATGAARDGGSFAAIVVAAIVASRRRRRTA